MARFLGRVQGQRGEAHRLGHRSIDVVAASWSGAVYTTLTERDGATWCEIHTGSWKGEGAYNLIYDGPLIDLSTKFRKAGKAVIA